jgi:hypothetical protein
VLAAAHHRFVRALAETIAWCNSRIDPRNPIGSLRSPFLCPEVFADGAVYFEPSSVPRLVAERRLALRTAIPRPYDRERGCGYGRLLICAPAYSNANGLAEEASRGFFDYNDIPPWDTWVGCVQGLPGAGGGDFGSSATWLPCIGCHPRELLVSWVHPAFLPLADAGLSTECIGMLTWADALIPQGGGPAFSQALPSWLTRLAAVWVA